MVARSSLMDAEDVGFIREVSDEVVMFSGHHRITHQRANYF